MLEMTCGELRSLAAISRRFTAEAALTAEQVDIAKDFIFLVETVEREKSHSRLRPSALEYIGQTVWPKLPD